MTLLEAMQVEYGKTFPLSYINDGNTMGVFSYSSALADMFDQTDNVFISQAYYTNRFKKQISPYYRTILEAYPGFDFELSELLAKYLDVKFADKWRRDYAMLVTEQTDVDVSYHESVTKDGSDTRKIDYNNSIEDDGNTGSKVVTDDEEGIAGFNSSDYSDSSHRVNTVTANKNDNTSHNKRDKTGTDTTTDTYGHIVTTRGSRLPKQDMIVKELDLRAKYKLIDIIFADIDSVLVQPLYI